MTPLFIDTGGFCAAFIREDRHHLLGAEVMRAAVSSGAALITTNHVLGETYTLLRTRFDRPSAWRFRDAVDQSAAMEIVHVDEELERDAWELLRKYADQSFSYVDATSFALMRARRIRRALAFDHHFAAAGFVRVPMDAPLG